MSGTTPRNQIQTTTIAVRFVPHQRIFAFDSQRKLTSCEILPGCAKFDYNSPAFGYVRALYNVTDWQAAVQSENETIDTTGVEASCFERVRVNAGSRGVISDGPGAYGRYTETSLFGEGINIWTLSYAPVGGQGYANVEITFDGTLLALVQEAQWDPPAQLRFLGDASAVPSGALLELVRGLNDEFLTVTSISYEEVPKVTATVLAIPGLGQLELEGVGALSLVIAAFCVEPGGGCYP
eukprot:3280466-Rhodomonas_salina.3